MTARPRPTMAAVSTTQSTVTAPDSLATKVLIWLRKVMMLLQVSGFDTVTVHCQTENREV